MVDIIPSLVFGRFSAGVRIHVRHKHVYVRRRSAYIGAQNSPLSAIISAHRGLIQISQMRNQDAKRKRIERKLASLVASIEPALVSLDKHDSNRVLHDTERIIRPENMKTSSTAVNGRIHQLQIGGGSRCTGTCVRNQGPSGSGRRK
jgi:hypothetical protein